MAYFDRFERTEKVLIMGGSAGLVICLSLFFLIDKYANENVLAQTAEIGTISSQQNDTRHKSNGSFVWYPSRERQPIRIGDAVFAGENSSTQIRLKKGGELTITENSLVRFREVEQQNIADLSSGNFVLKVDGTVKVAINGTVTELEGKNSEVQIKVQKNKKPQVRLIQGQAKVKKSGRPSIHLDTKKVAILEPDPAPAKETPREVAAIQKVGPEEPALPLESEIVLQEPEPIPVAEAPKPYIWKLYDLYDQKDFQLFERELADANPVFLEGVEPSASLKTARLDLPFSSVGLKISLSSPIDSLGYVVEAAQNESFGVGKTRTFWSASANLDLMFYQPGVYYYRFRTVNKNQELSEWSETSVFTIVKPPMPQPPVLIRAKTEGFPGDKFQALWKSETEKAAAELTTASGELLKTADGGRLSFKALKPGHYMMRAYSIDKYGRWSSPSPPVKILVADKKVEVLPLAKKEEPPPPPPEEPKREFAGQTEKPSASSSLKIETMPDTLNRGYKSSKFSVEGFSWALLSSQQYFQNKEAPIAIGAGLHVLKWFEQSGIEARYKTAVAGVNDSGKETKLQTAEARFHYRFISAFPFRLFHQLQTSIFAGYEMYRNSGDLVSNQYDLIKFGTSLQFPMGKRWGTGGEFIYGQGTEGSNKKEVSGHIDYYFGRRWALGVGYRLHLFEAGSAKTAPGGLLPYREGYTEGYSVIDYNF